MNKKQLINAIVLKRIDWKKYGIVPMNSKKSLTSLTSDTLHKMYVDEKNSVYNIPKNGETICKRHLNALDANNKEFINKHLVKAEIFNYIIVLSNVLNNLQTTQSIYARGYILVVPKNLKFIYNQIPCGRHYSSEVALECERMSRKILQEMSIRQVLPYGMHLPYYSLYSDFKKLVKLISHISLLKYRLAT
jgi:hypothetical protein